MTRIVALTLVIAALIAVGAWAALSTPDDAEQPPSASLESAEAASSDGFVPLPYLSDEPVQRFDAPEQVLDPDLDYRAEFHTTAGIFTVDLYEARAPDTVNVIVFLALHRFYEGVPFHRVIEDFMAQTGDPTGTGSGGPGFQFADEIVSDLSHDRAGLLSMANRGPGTNGSQFFVTFGPAPWLDGRHAIFGEVTSGGDVLADLTRVDPETPSVVATLAEPASTLAEQGVEEAQGSSGTVEEFLVGQLGEVPDPGQSFRVAGRRGVSGSVSGAAAIGLFPVPDRIERVTVLARPKEELP